MYIRCHPVPLRRALAVVTNEGRVAVDAGSAVNERCESVRQRRVVLTPRGWRRRWQQCMAHRGERVISRKAIAQGMSDVLRCPVCSCAHFLCTLRMRSRVQRASGIPCALCIERAGNTFKPRAHHAARSRSHILGDVKELNTRPTRSLREALATKQSTAPQAERWIASLRSQ